MAIILRNKAMDDYYKNPKVCLECGKIIHVGNKKVSDIRKKKFCNHHCAAVFNNKKYPKRIKKIKEKVKRVKKEDFYFLIGTTKLELRNRCLNWQSWRTTIRRHAAHLYKIKTNGNIICENCGYDKHIQVCHLKPVSEFKDNELITDINNKDNLIGLCPNCHWELDHELLKL